MSSFFFYLIQVSAGLVLLSLVYKLLFEKLTFFDWNRSYLVAGLCICMLLPTIPTSSLLALFQSTQENPIVRSIQTTSDFSLKILPLPFSSYPTKEISSPFIFLHILFAVYLAGAIYKSAQLIMSLSFLAKLRRKSILKSTNHYYKTYTQSIQPTFSFGKSIFLHTDSDKLSSEELDQVLLHEQTHIRQYHSVDIMLFEIKFSHAPYPYQFYRG